MGGFLGGQPGASTGFVRTAVTAGQRDEIMGGGSISLENLRAGLGGGAGPKAEAKKKRKGQQPATGATILSDNQRATLG